MARFKLIYFKGRSRAEISRLIFHAAGEEFQDQQLDDNSFAELKTTSPTGSLPMLINLDTNETLTQSLAIARYLAAEFGLDGKDNYQRALVDSVADTMNDLLGDIVEISFEDDTRRKKERIRRFRDRNFPETIGFLERFVEKYGSNQGTSVGNDLTYADLVIYNTLDQTVLNGVSSWQDFERYPRVYEIVRRLENTPRIAQYLKTRPAAAF